MNEFTYNHSAMVTAKSNRITQTILTLSVLGFLLTSCTKTGPIVPIPTGVQTMTGILLATKIDVLRRGTHLLRVRQNEQYYVESSLVNLRAAEGKLVVIRGTFERNSDPTLAPILVAQEMRVSSANLQEISVDTLGFTASVPTEWLVSKGPDETLILLPGISQPIGSIRIADGTGLPPGSPFLVDNRHASRSTDPVTAVDTVTVDHDGTFVTFRLTALNAPDIDLLKTQWSQFLSSVRFATVSGAASAATGSGSGMPCGGTAGILCPPGQYCAITDVTENVGRCRK